MPPEGFESLNDVADTDNHRRRHLSWGKDSGLPYSVVGGLNEERK